MTGKPASNWYKLPGNRHARGYGHKWNQLRLTILERDKYLCIACERIGKVTIANTVDHIKPKAQGGADDASNLQALCRPCHKAKTAREASGSAMPGCDVDGLPADRAHHWNR